MPADRAEGPLGPGQQVLIQIGEALPARWSPTAPNARPDRASRSRSRSVSWPASGMAPMFLAAKETARFTRLPHVATSSSLFLRTNSLQVKSVSWFSGPATAR